MSFFRISHDTFVEQVQKIIPEWNIIISPNDFIPNPEKYREVTITVTNRDNKKITREAKIPLLESHEPPNHFAIITMNISSLVCKETTQDDLKLHQSIFDQLSRFFDACKNQE
jgi:hypothetical protein